MKYGLISLAVLLLGCFFFWQAIKCKEPDNLTVAVMQLECARNMNIDDITKKACEKIYGNPICTFSGQPDDAEVIGWVIKQTVNDCVIKELKANHMCTESYGGL